MTISQGFLLSQLLPQFVAESLDSSGSLVAAGGDADLSTIDITSVVGTDGQPGDVLQSLGNGLASWQPNVSLSYEFKVTYDVFDIDSVQELPEGWTLDSQTSNRIWISHDAGKVPKAVSYLSYQEDGDMLLVNAPANTVKVSSVDQARNSFNLVADGETTSCDNTFSIVNIVF